MPKTIRKQRVRKYSDEFRVNAVQLSLLPNVKVQEVAASLSIHPYMLSRWRKDYREGRLVPDNRKKVIKPRKVDLENQRIRELALENARLKKENELLKKFQRFLADRK